MCLFQARPRMQQTMGGVIALSCLLIEFAHGWQLTTPTGKSNIPASEPANVATAPANPPQAAADTIAAITARLQQIQEDTEKPAEAKESLIKLYQQSLADWKAANESQKLRQQWQARTAAAPRSMEEAKAKRTQGTTRTTIGDILEYMSFDEVQKELQSLQSQLTTATETRTKLAEQAVAREKRRKDLPQLISDSKAALESIGTTQSPAHNSEDPLLKEAVGWSMNAARTAAMENVQTLEAEQKAYEAEAELLLLQLEIAQANEKQLQEPVRKMTEEFNRMRQDRILQVREQVRRLVANMPTELKDPSNELLKRIADWLALADKKATVKSELDNSKSNFDRWKERFAKMSNRVNPKDGQELTAGFNSWVGLMLRKQRSELPDPAKIGSQIRYFQSEMQIAESMLFEVEDKLLEIGSNLEANRIASQTASTDQLVAERQLLEKSKEVLSAIQVDVNSYLNDLYQVADLKEQTRTLSDKYQAFIDEHVLWIRSSEQLKRSDMADLVEAFRWLANTENWRGLGNALLADFKDQPWWYIAFGLGWMGLMFSQSRLRRAMSALSDQAAKRNCTNFLITTKASLITLIISMPVATLFLFTYWRLSQIETGDYGFALALANGLLLATAVFFPLEVLRQTSRVGGLGMKHFDWTDVGARILRTNLRWLIDCTLPLSIIVGIFGTYNNPRWEASLGRVAFLGIQLVLTAFFARVFFPSSGILTRYLKSYPNGWFERLRYGWYSVLVVLPLSLAAISFVGYHYTAQQLALHLNTTLWVVISLTLTFFILQRWLVIGKRKLMIAQAKQRLAEAAKRDPNQTTPSLPTGVSEETELNLVSINEQTMRLVSSVILLSGLVGIFMIWSDVLPAIALLENFELWTVRGDKPDETIKITLANILLVIPIFALMIIAGRNVPGLLEIALLQHLPITSAARYAITTLSRYLIVIVGILFLFNTIGLRWSSIQWLVAALGVGLGFGLQEIFANFVSGLILLFEQPIRVGDVITLDGTTGSVSKIRMRATTIVNWDRQELIIPNKDLITGKLLNWTLSDTTNRIVINVGIAYGSDTEQACATIMQICKDHPNILPDPAPVVSFDAFGESTLKLTLRAFLANLDVRLQTLHELNTRIHRAFNEAGIEISFPQRDLHIRSIPAPITDWFRAINSGFKRYNGRAGDPLTREETKTEGH